MNTFYRNNISVATIFATSVGKKDNSNYKTSIACVNKLFKIEFEMGNWHYMTGKVKNVNATIGQEKCLKTDDTLKSS